MLRGFAALPASADCGRPSPSARSRRTRLTRYTKSPRAGTHAASSPPNTPAATLRDRWRGTLRRAPRSTAAVRLLRALRVRLPARRIINPAIQPLLPLSVARRKAVLFAAGGFGVHRPAAKSAGRAVCRRRMAVTPPPQVAGAAIVKRQRRPTPKPTLYKILDKTSAHLWLAGHFPRPNPANLLKKSPCRCRLRAATHKGGRRAGVVAAFPLQYLYTASPPMRPRLPAAAGQVCPLPFKLCRGAL